MLGRTHYRESELLNIFQSITTTRLEELINRKQIRYQYVDGGVCYLRGDVERIQRSLKRRPRRRRLKKW